MHRIIALAGRIRQDECDEERARGVPVFPMEGGMADKRSCGSRLAPMGCWRRRRPGSKSIGQRRKAAEAIATDALTAFAAGTGPQRARLQRQGQAHLTTFCDQPQDHTLVGLGLTPRNNKAPTPPSGRHSSPRSVGLVVCLDLPGITAPTPGAVSGFHSSDSRLRGGSSPGTPSKRPGPPA